MNEVSVVRAVRSWGSPGVGFVTRDRGRRVAFFGNAPAVFAALDEAGWKLTNAPAVSLGRFMDLDAR